MRALPLLALAAVLGACSGATPADGGAPDAAPDLEPCPPMPASGDIPCDVGAVLAARCQICHTLPRMNGAPFPLLTYEQLHAQFGTTSLLKWQRMAQVIEPDNLPHMPPAGRTQLDDTEIGVLRGWFAQCAPPVAEGTGCDVDEDGGAAPVDAASPADGGVG